MNDSWGDGWNGATLSVSDCDGNVLESGLTMSGSFLAVDVCLPESDGYTITAGGGSWDSEITWSLIDPAGTTQMEGAAGTVSTCGSCDDNDWDLHLNDSWGDGWNGATLSVTDCDGNVLESALSISWGSFSAVDVCLPESDGYTITAGGGNWDSEITWSLIDPAGNTELEGAAGTVSTCTEPCDDNDWDLHLNDSWGDGWNGATLSVTDCDGTTLESGLSMSGSFEAVDVCLPDSDGFIITAGGGNWDGEISWALIDPAGNTQLTGAAGTTDNC